MPPVLRSILAIVVGFLTINFVIIVLTLIVVLGRSSQGGHAVAPPAYLVIASFLGCLAGGFVCGLVAGRKALQHAMALGCIMLFFGIFSFLRLRGQQPLWYQLLMITVPPLLVLVGAALFARQHAAHTGTRR